MASGFAVKSQEIRSGHLDIDLQKADCARPFNRSDGLSAAPQAELLIGAGEFADEILGIGAAFGRANLDDALHCRLSIVLASTAGHRLGGKAMLPGGWIAT
ncbi:hypothetical protein [Jiella marina]|uniref:hypothetical protein n=1 Tax=Jiella sp. LLJ827 TaxID=2917712 RepID=UPI002101052C|nr:hypothetical protein [Jiella sp. LLJ827]MCQ0987768.1 hypothetical protein [Jiella sp. LLJ827]